jgi:outer membrane protein
VDYFNILRFLVLRFDIFKKFKYFNNTLSFMKNISIHIKHQSVIFFPIILVLVACSIAWPAEDNTDTLHVTLRQAIDIALQSNRSLIAAANSSQVSSLSLDSARSDFDYKIFPTARAGAIDGDEAIGAGVELDRRFQNGIDFSVSPSIARSNGEHSGIAGLSFDLPLMRGRGKEVNLDYVDSMAFSYRSAERAVYQTKVSTVIQTVSAVYYVLEQQKTAALLEEQVIVMKRYAESARLKKDVGLASEMDVYRALIQLKNVEDNLSSVKSSLSKAKDTLKRILAVSLEQPIEVEASTTDIKEVSLPVDDAIQTALENRIEITTARDYLRETERKSSVATHNLQPQLDFVVNYERFSNPGAFNDAWDVSENRWTANLVTTTDWARTREKASYQQSLLNIKNAELNLQAQKDEIIAEVRNQIEILQNWKDRIRIRKEQIIQATGKQKLARLKFDHDMADNFDLIEAESQLYQARVDLLSVETEYIVNQYRMRSALGILFNQKGELNLG